MIAMRLYTCNRLREIVVVAEPGYTITDKRFYVESSIVPEVVPTDVLVDELWKRYASADEAGTRARLGPVGWD